MESVTTATIRQLSPQNILILYRYIDVNIKTINENKMSQKSWNEIYLVTLND